MDIVTLRDSLLKGGTGLTSDFKPYEQLHQEVKELEALSNIDPLTGAPNRRKFEEDANLVHAEFLRGASTYGLVFIDIDNFKNLNDDLGHDAGDAFLRGIVELADSVKRKTDTFYRLGGDEFVLLMRDLDPDSSTDVTQKFVERIRILVEYQKKSHEEDVYKKVGLSVGIAFPEVDESMSDVLKRADAEMYMDKKDKNNRNIKLMIE